MAQTLRYWDGLAWTEHVSPMQAGAYQSAARGGPVVGASSVTPTRPWHDSGPTGPYVPAGGFAVTDPESSGAGYALAVLIPIVGLIYGAVKWRTKNGPGIVIVSIVCMCVYTWLLNL